MTHQELEHRPMPDHDGWPAFVISGEDGLPGPTDLSALLEKPAGAKGMIQIVDGHLADGEGQRWRIWGQNLTARMTLPPGDLAPKIARHLAKNGVNCIRLHFMDLRWPNGLLIRSRQPAVPRKMGAIPTRIQTESTRMLDPEALARLDYFVACCKENGVYIDLNLNVARPFTEADGVAQADWIGYAKALTYFDLRLIELQKEYAAQLLNHLNPFTQARYADEPAIALVEILNENSLLESWLCDRLRGEQTQPCGTWSDIPPLYAADLDLRWNLWLARRYTSHAQLADAWKGDLAAGEELDTGNLRRLRKSEFAAASAGRFADESEFYAQIERDYFVEMTRYLREEVGVKQIILGTSDHNQGLNNPLHLENLSRLGITDGHFYWQHPEFPGQDWSPKHWTITNTPMEDSPDQNVIARLARSKVKGMPYLVSETNCPFPNDFAASFIPILAAYGRFHDWDGIFLYTYNESGGDDGFFSEKIRSFFAIGSDPTKMTAATAAGLAFLRGDVKQALQSVERRMTRAQLIQSQRTPLADAPYMLPDLLGRTALAHRVEIASFDAAENSPLTVAVDAANNRISSDTGELTWETVALDGRVRVDTPRWQLLTGRAGERSTANLSAAITAPYAVVQVISLEDRPLSLASKILLTVAARVANTGMLWKDDSRQSLGDQMGDAPTRIEPVTGVIALRGLQQAHQVTLTPLDGCGQASMQPLPLVFSAGGWQVALADAPVSPWYLLEIER